MGGFFLRERTVLNSSRVSRTKGKRVSSNYRNRRNTRIRNEVSEAELSLREDRKIVSSVIFRISFGRHYDRAERSFAPVPRLSNKAESRKIENKFAAALMIRSSSLRNERVLYIQREKKELHAPFIRTVKSFVCTSQ